MAVCNQSWIDGCECAEMIFWCQQILIFLCAFLCNSDRCSFKINGERIGQLLLWECHGLNQAGFVEVNRQWPGSVIHWCHHTDVNSKSQEPATGKAEQPWPRKGAGRVWGEQGRGLLEEQAGTQTQLAPRPSWHWPQPWAAWGTGATARQQNSRDWGILVHKNVLSPLPAWLWDCQKFCVTSPCPEAAVRGHGAPPHSGLGPLQGLVTFCETAPFNPFTYKRDLFGKF